MRTVPRLGMRANLRYVANLGLSLVLLYVAFCGYCSNGLSLEWKCCVFAIKRYLKKSSAFTDYLWAIGITYTGFFRDEAYIFATLPFF